MMRRRLFCVAALLVVACRSQQQSATGGEGRPPPAAVEGMRHLSSADLHLGPDSSTEVISSAQKFIVPVPAWGRAGEPLTYPKGHEREGQPVLDFQGKPVGDRGLVFFNGKDKSWQAVAGDGQGVIIINEVTSDQAAMLDRRIRSLVDDPRRLNLPQMKQALNYAREDLGLGDMYNSTRSFIQTKMSPAIPAEVPRVEGKEIDSYGLHKRDDRDVCRAVYVAGRFSFAGPAGTPQIFEDGGVVVEQNGEQRGVQPDVFVRTYRHKDGRPIESVTRDVRGFSP